MKILQLHADFIEYKPVKKEIQGAEESDGKLVREEDLVVLFTAVEDGDDVAVAKQAIGETAAFLSKLGTRRVMLYPFAHLSQDLASPSDALQVVLAMEKEAKDSGLETMRAPFGWTKALQIKVKGHPLAEMSRSYSSTQAPKRGQAPPAKRRKEAPHEELLARMKKVDHAGLPQGDHRLIGEKLDLFSFYEPSPSMPYWHDKGVTLRNILVDTIRQELRRRGYQEVSTPLMANVDLWKVSGHWEHYKDNMFLTKLKEEDEDSFGLKPMNCPSTILYYMSKKWSYRDLPVRLSDFDMLHRKELSGVVSGLFRVKSFMQDDAHIFCTEGQIGEELRALVDLTSYFYGIFKLQYTPKVSTMPEEHLGSKEQWEDAVKILVDTVKSKGIEPIIKEKEGAFYGPKIDVDVKDSLGREWQCATIQLDFQLPLRFGLTYTGDDGKEHTPVIIHRVIYGSLERFIGVMLEHYKGSLPVWLSPVQARVVPLSDPHVRYGKEVLESLRASGVRAEGDFEQGTLGAKIRDAQLQKIPYVVVVGGKEEESKTIAVREREGQQRFGVSPGDFATEVLERSKRFE